MCLDPITMQPHKLIFAHWNLTEQYGATLDTLKEVSYQGADVSTIRELDARLEDIEEQISTSEVFLRLLGFNNIEIYQ